MIATSSIPLSASELAAAVRGTAPYDASRLDRVLRVDERHAWSRSRRARREKAIAAALRPGDARAAHRRPR